MLNKILILLTIIVKSVLTAKILVVVPTPSVSHQVIFRPLTQELANRGHEITIITADPVFKENKRENITEIDVHDISYKAWAETVINSKTTNGKNDNLLNQVINVFTTLLYCFEQQVLSDGVQEILKSNKKYDLLIIEAFARPALAFTHIFKAPVILVSSLGSLRNMLDIVGAPKNPKLLYPDCLHQKIYNLTLWDKLKTLKDVFFMDKWFSDFEEKEDAVVKRLFGDEMPSLNELQNNVDMLFLNLHSIWELNRPVPPSVVYIGGIHQNPPKDISKDLKQYLDSSKNGVIYVSFGTNVNPSQLPDEKIRILLNVFSRLPYDILWKCDIEKLPGKPDNLKTAHWLPQPDLLKHPKIKLFITQGGLQSTDEALIAGVPLIGIPLLGDQWYNVQQYVKHGIGEAVEMETLTEEELLQAVDTVINNDSYLVNIRRLRTLLYDQPQTPLQRAVWWTEHVLRHGGAKHLRAPAANMSWLEFLDIELLLVLIGIPLLILILFILGMIKLVLFLRQSNFHGVGQKMLVKNGKLD